MESLTRDEVQRMIDYTMAATILPAIRGLEMRIVGIDGNGTGREGVLQRQDRKLEEMDNKLEKLVNRSQSWSKKNIWDFAKWVFGGFGALALMILSQWISHNFVK